MSRPRAAAVAARPARARQPVPPARRSRGQYRARIAARSSGAAAATRRSPPHGPAVSNGSSRRIRCRIVPSAPVKCWSCHPPLPLGGVAAAEEAAAAEEEVVGAELGGERPVAEKEGTGLIVEMIACGGGHRN